MAKKIEFKDTVFVKINNIKKYIDYSQKRVERPHWLKLSNQIHIDQNFLEFTHEEKWCWICILCESSLQKTDNLKINFKYHCPIWNVSEASLMNCLLLLKQNHIVSLISRLSTNSENRSREEGHETRRDDLNLVDPSSTKDTFDFLKLYEKYPRKEGKSKGLLQCKAQIKSQDDYDSLSAAIEKYSAICRREGKEKKFIKIFSTFMQNGSWRDLLDEDYGKLKLSSIKSESPKFEVFNDTIQEPEKPLTQEEIEQIESIKTKFQNMAKFL